MDLRNAKIIKCLTAVLFAVITAFASCAGRTEESKTVERQEAEAPLVTYCRNIDYTDTLSLRNESIMRQNVATIIKMLPVSDSATVRAGMTAFFNGLRHDGTALSVAAGCLGEYLNNPASPVRNEEYYINVLSVLLDTDSLPEIVREPAAERLRIASLNRKGTIASDIVFDEPDGTRRSLHGIESPLTLLIFYDPECSHCAEILKGVAATEILNEAICEGNVKVVAIYTEGKRDVWLGATDDMPGNWIVGYDRSEIVENEIYDIPAMPVLYLLDSEKRVLEKDPDSRLLPRLLRSHLSR